MNKVIKTLEAKNVELEEMLEDEIALSKEIEQNYLEAKEKLKIAVKLLTSLRSLIELSIDSEHNYESWLSRNKEALEKIKAK